MTPTRARSLVPLAVLGGVAGWAVTTLVDRHLDRTLPVPLTVPFLMAALALAVAMWARGTRARLERRHGTKPIPPEVAARSAALAMAVSRTGAVVGGFYAGVALTLTPSLGVEYVRGIALVAAATVLASLALVAAGLWLERVCRIPPSDGDEADREA